MEDPEVRSEVLIYSKIGIWDLEKPSQSVQNNFLLNKFASFFRAKMITFAKYAA